MRAAMRSKRALFAVGWAALFALAAAPMATGCSTGEADDVVDVDAGIGPEGGALPESGPIIAPEASPCGNKKVDTGEECDDGNTASNDGCSATCALESGGAEDLCGGAPLALATTGASTLYTAHVAGTTAKLFNHYGASCGGGSGADAVYVITPPRTGRAVARVTAGFDAVLSVRTGCDDPKTELGCNSTSAPAADAGAGTTLAFPVFAGKPVYVFVDGYGGAKGDFVLDVDVQTAACGNGKAEYPELCDDGNTVGGDGCSATCAMEDGATASDCPGMGYRLKATAAAPGSVSFAGDTTSLGNAGGSAVGCSPSGSGPNAVYAITPTISGSIALSLLANYPKALLHVRRECSDSATQFDCRASDAELTPLTTTVPVNAEETIYVYVDGDSSSKGLFTLDAKLTVAACGNGAVDTGEECDDGNMTGGDGCSATCAVERDAASYTCPGKALRLESAAAGARTLKLRGTTAPAAGEALPASKFSTCGSSAPDVVYQVTSDIDGWLTATVSGGQFNGAVSLRAACPGTSDLACDKSGSGNDPDTLHAAMNKETSYFVIVDGATTGKSGPFELTLTVAPSVCGNGVTEGGETCDDGATADGDGCDATCKLETDTARDECATAPLFTLDANADGTYGATIVSGTTNLTHPASPTHTLSPCSSTGPDGYYPFVAPISGVVTASLDSATFASSLGVRSACLPSGTQLTCDATTGNGGQEIVFSATQGSTYWLAVAGANVSGAPKQSGRFTMSVKVVPAGCGDTFVNAPEVCDDGNTLNGDGCSSTCALEALGGITACPGHAVALSGVGAAIRKATATVSTTSLPSNTASACGGSGPEGVLKITPDVSGQLLIKATAGYAVILHARTTCNDPNTEIAKASCSSSYLSQVSAAVTKNVPYYVFVDGMNGQSGVAKLQITVTP
jgi:cysteine-rich repeat protein